MAPKDQYYKILGVDKKADDNAIKSAYKKAALKHHPDRNPNNVDEARKKFQEVSEAFEVLSDPNKRTLYDQFGEDGLKGGGAGPPPGAGGAGGFPGGMGGNSFPGGSFHFSSAGPGAPNGFTPTDPEEIFKAFFGGSGGGPSGFGGGGLGGLFGGMGGAGPSAGMRGRARPQSGFGFGGPMGGMDGMDLDDDFGGMPGSFGMNGGAMRGRRSSSPGGPSSETVRPHPFALEDLYKGGTKKLKVMRRKANGREEPVVVEVPVKPGWKAGTKVRFPNQGNEDASGKAGTLCIEVQQKPHPKFTRDGDDLIMQYRLTLAECLTGVDPANPSNPSPSSRSVETLDGRKLSFVIPFPNATRGGAPIQPGQVIRKFAGEGMPISKKGATKAKGDLILKADVSLPDRVTVQQVEEFKKILGITK